MKKKLLVSTMAASLVASSFAGLPLSDKGILNKLGLGASVVQAAALPSDELVQRMNKIHDKILPEDIQDVRDARNRLSGLTDTSVISEIWSKVNSKKGSQAGYEDVTESNLLKLVAELGFGYFRDGSDVNDYRTDPTNRAVIDQLAKLSGQSSGLGDLNFNDITAFSGAIEKGVATNVDFNSLPVLALDPEGAKDIVKPQIESVLNDDTYKFSKVLKGLGINSSDLANAMNKISAQVDPGGKARIALAIAYVRSEAVFSSTINGNTLIPALTIMGKAIPNGILTWTKVSGDASITVGADGTVFLAGTGTGSAIIKASLLNKELYSGPVSLTVSNNSGRRHSGGGGGGGISVPGVGVTPPANIGDVISGVTQAINNLKQEFASASAERKEQLLRELKEAIEAAISKIATLDVSAAVTIDGDKATVKLDTAAIVAQLKTIMEEANKLNDQIKALDSTAPLAKVELTLDLGAVDATTVDAPLAQDLLAQIQAAGVDTIAIKVNGVVVAFGSHEFTKDTTVSIKKEEPSVASSLTSMRVASDVYNFEITSGGSQVTEFVQPIELRFPIANLLNIDAELLSTAKIVNGALVFYGGMYNAERGNVSVLRKSFSTYAVVENKVSFNDTASVDSWAGRHIAVAAAKGIIEGREEGEFVPNASVTRAEFAKMIVKAFGVEDNTATEGFNDVNDNDWFKPYVAAAAKAGLINGRADGVFDPNAKITRAEMATIASRALQSLKEYRDVANPDEALKGFADASSINSTLKAGVAFAAAKGIVEGVDNSKFDPNSDSTRAQAAVIIYRILNTK